MKIHSIDPGPYTPAVDVPVKPSAPSKSRLKRLLERQFPGVLKSSASSEKLSVDPGGGGGGGGGAVFPDVEPSSVCLAKMVQSFIEETNNNESKASKCGRCNCFNGHDSSDDDSSGESPPTAPVDACDLLKGLVPCSTTAERNLLADASKVLELNKTSIKNKDASRRMLVDGLMAVGYDASLCRSRWDKSPSFPAGEYEYVDVVVNEERLIVDVDFKSEFEIARSTKGYKSVLQSLPSIFVGKPDRLQQIVAVVSEAAKQSLKKKGLHFPPWRKPEYMKAKWLSPHQRLTPSPPSVSATEPSVPSVPGGVIGESCLISTPVFSGEFELRLRSRTTPPSAASSTGELPPPVERITVVISPRQPVASRPRVVAGLASVLREKP
ncbi:hypothetical protein QJS10_CPA08g00204 [Acorus calamus]|uniref:Uncharacterized protein n=1 Tax=Acorus calamus TaxID=4465 RepID=A0AAV9ECT4_ACOCL|nr:hypothetical protein QJS10_CPA08g00204 [Acorus calamus]